MKNLNYRISLVGTALAFAGAVLYWLALSNTMSSFPPQENILSSIEVEAKLFFASSLALLYWRTTGDKWLSSLPVSIIFGAIAFFMSGWILNTAVWLVPQETKIGSVFAIARVQQMAHRDSTPTKTLLAMKESFGKATQEDIDKSYRRFLSDHLREELTNNKDRLLVAYRDVGNFMRPYWKHYTGLEASGSRRKWATSVQMQKAIWSTKEINDYCKTSLSAPGMSPISPCDFQLWQDDDRFISDVVHQQETEIKKATCKHGCPLLEGDILDRSFKLMWLPFMAWGAVHLALTLYLLGMMALLVQASVRARASNKS